MSAPGPAMTTMRQRSTCRAAALLATLSLLALARARFSVAGDANGEPGAAAPAPAPSLALSDKPPLGCCCISTNEPGSKTGCSYGLSEDKCRLAGQAVATWSASWTPGKCTPP